MLKKKRKSNPKSNCVVLFSHAQILYILTFISCTQSAVAQTHICTKNIEGFPSTELFLFAKLKGLIYLSTRTQRTVGEGKKWTRGKQLPHWPAYTRNHQKTDHQGETKRTPFFNSKSGRGLLGQLNLYGLKSRLDSLSKGNYSSALSSSISTFTSHPSTQRWHSGIIAYIFLSRILRIKI